MISIVIPVFNKWELTWKCLLSIARHTRGIPHEVIVVDDASSDETVDALPLLTDVRWHRNPANAGFASTVNTGARMARGDYLLFLNNDTEVHADWLPPMLSILARRPEVAAVGCKLLFPDGTIQHGGVVFSYAGPDPITPFHLDYRQPADARNQVMEMNAVTAACMLVRKEAFWQVGGMDEGFRNGHEDVDLCLKLREAGWRIVYTPDAVVTHHESVSDGRFNSEWRNLERFLARWTSRFTAFDLDFRSFAKPAPVDPARPGVGVVVVVDNAVSTIAPCLENLRHNLGPQDQLVVVNDGSRPATRAFLDLFERSYPGRARCLHNPQRLGFTAAVARGLEEVATPLSAVLPANVKVVAGWLDRCVRHLVANPALGAVSPLEGDQSGFGDVEKIYPPASPDAAAANPPLLPAGELEVAAIPPSLCLVGDRRLLLDVAQRPGHDANASSGGGQQSGDATARDAGPAGAAPSAVAAASSDDVFFGLPPDSLGRALARRRRLLAVAADAVVYRFNEIVLSGEPRALRGRYLEALNRLAVGPGMPRLSVVVVSDGSTDGQAESLGACLEALFAHTRRPHEVLVVDDGGDQAVRRLLDGFRQRQPALRVLRNEMAEGLVFARNQGLAEARGDFVALLDGDALVPSGWAERLLALLTVDPTLGAAGPRLNRAAGLQWSSRGADIAPEDVPALVAQTALEHRGEVAHTRRLAGSCVMLARRTLEMVGAFDASYVTGTLADQDHGIRAARLGLRLGLCLDLYVHTVSGNGGGRSPMVRRLEREDGELLAARWGAQVNEPGWQPPADGGPSDHLPLAASELFHRRAPALRLTRPNATTRLLCLPDFGGDNRQDVAAVEPGWTQVLSAYLEAFASGDPVALVLRIEPPSPRATEHAVEQISRWLQQRGRSPDDIPDVVLEASPLTARDRPGLYTGATALVRCPGPRQRQVEREAEACGLPILEPSAEALRGARAEAA